MRVATRPALFGLTLSISLAAAAILAPHANASQGSIWRTDVHEAINEARSKGQLIFLHFYGPNCPPCLRMEKQVLNSREVAEAFGDRVMAIKVNGNQHPKLRSRFSVENYPSDVLVDPNGKSLWHGEGAMELKAYATRISLLVKKHAPATKSEIASSDDKLPPKPKHDPSLPDEGKDGETKVAKKPVDDASDASGAAAEEAAETIVVALDGYDPVTLRNSAKWVAGRKEFTSVYNGQTYLFENDKQRKAFEANPSKFAPRLLGCDPVVLLETQEAVPGKVSFGSFYDGELYLFESAANRTKFKSEPTKYNRTKHVLRPDEIKRRKA
jgi:YHS domain-containing protein/thiol-disulfide isomerase/thioredoxin